MTLISIDTNSSVIMMFLCFGNGQFKGVTGSVLVGLGNIHNYGTEIIIFVNVKLVRAFEYTTTC